MIQLSVAPDLTESYLRLSTTGPRTCSASLGEIRDVHDAGDGTYLSWLEAQGVRHSVTHTQSGVPIHVLRSAHAFGSLPIVIFFHAGGMVSGRWHTGLRPMLPPVVRAQAVVASVEYRLAPEHRYPAQLDDAVRHLNVARTIVSGFSAGGGLAAAVSLYLRDHGLSSFSHQILLSPMLDHRLLTSSSTMINGDGVWNASESRFAWESYLGDHRPSPRSYAAPGTREDLAGLPQTLITVGTVDGFRDDAVEFARRLSECGTSATLVTAEGGYHGFEVHDPQAPTSLAHLARIDSFLTAALSEYQLSRAE